MASWPPGIMAVFGHNPSIRLVAASRGSLPARMVSYSIACSVMACSVMLMACSPMACSLVACSVMAYGPSWVYRPVGAVDGVWTGSLMTRWPCGLVADDLVSSWDTAVGVFRSLIIYMA